MRVPSWRSAISTAADTPHAIAEIAAALAGGDVPDLVFLFATPHHASDALGARVSDALGARHLLGCSGAGVLASGREIERGPAIAVAAGWLPGARLASFPLAARALATAEATRESAESAGAGAAEGVDFVVLADPFRADVAALVAGLDEAFPGSRKIGGLASGGSAPGTHRLWVGRDAVAEGAALVAVGGAVAIDPIVAQGCRPIGDPMFVTRHQGNHLYALDGRPALDVLRRLYDSLPAEDRALFRHSLFVGIAMNDERTEFRAGDFLVRNLVGAEAARGAIAVGADLRGGQVVQFHLRDARAAADDLRAALEHHRSESTAPAGAALLFSCLGRGAGLYGRPDHDSGLVRGALGEIPVAGFFANGEIGPVGGKTFLHGYTSSLAVFRER
jgi:small ligand-binding sensory domain FIST